MKKYTYLLSLVFVIIAAFGCGKDSASPSSTTGETTGKGGSNARFTIVGDNLFTVSDKTLSVFDIKNPDNPIKVGETNVGPSIESIFSRGSTLFIGAANGLYIYDMTNPLSARLIAQPPHFPAHDPVVADDKYAYVTLHDGWVQGTGHSNVNQLWVFDITNLTNPVQVATYNMTHPEGLGVDNKTLFVCDNGLKVFDATDVKFLVQKNHFDIEADDVIPNNGDLLVIGSSGLYQYAYAKDTISLLSKINIVKTP